MHALALLAVLLAPPDWSATSDRWREALARHHVPGLAVAVVADDRVVHAEGFGVRDAGGGAVDEETVFYIASSTKPFTAFAVALLAEDGKLTVAAPVRSVLPRFELATPEAAAGVTILDLLSHRRGLTAHPAIVFNDAYTGQITEDRFYRLLARSRPHERFAYNNLHFTILGRVVEAASGLHWKELLARRVFTPLGMTRTSGNVSTFAGDPNVAVGLERTDDGFREVSLAKTDATMHAAGGLNTTALDLAKWIRLHLNGGVVDGTRLASARTMAAMTTPVVEFDDTYGPFTRDACAYGWNVGTYDGETLVHHFGGYVGFAAHVSFMPEHGVGVAVLANGDGAAANAIHLVACDVYDRLVGTQGGDAGWARLAEQEPRSPRGPEEPRPGPVEAGGLMLDADEYVGTYENADWGTIEMALEDGELAARIGNLRPRLASSALDGVRFDLFPGAQVNGWLLLDDAEETVTAFVIEPDGMVRSRRDGGDEGTTVRSDPFPARHQRTLEPSRSAADRPPAAPRSATPADGERRRDRPQGVSRAGTLGAGRPRHAVSLSTPARRLPRSAPRSSTSRPAARPASSAAAARRSATRPAPAPSRSRSTGSRTSSAPATGSACRSRTSPSTDLRPGIRPRRSSCRRSRARR